MWSQILQQNETPILTGWLTDVSTAPQMDVGLTGTTTYNSYQILYQD